MDVYGHAKGAGSGFDGEVPAEGEEPDDREMQGEELMEQDHKTRELLFLRAVACGNGDEIPYLQSLVSQVLLLRGVRSRRWATIVPLGPSTLVDVRLIFEQALDDLHAVTLRRQTQLWIIVRRLVSIMLTKLWELRCGVFLPAVTIIIRGGSNREGRMF